MSVTLKDIAKFRAKCTYTVTTYKGKSLLDWAVLWFKTSNDAFYEVYGFNFNPHKFPYLYDIAMEEVYGKQ